MTIRRREARNQYTVERCGVCVSGGEGVVLRRKQAKWERGERAGTRSEIKARY